MVRKLLGLFFITATLISATTGCSRKVEKPSRMTITFPKSDPGALVSHSVSALSTKWQIADPSLTSQINCYAVAIAAADFPGTPHQCSNLAGTELARPHFIAGGFPAGSTQELLVPAGAKRTIYLIGFQTSDATKCVSVDSSAVGLSNSHFSAPYILTQTTLDLVPGDNTVILQVPSSLPSSGKFEECLPFAFSRSSAPAPLTLSSISPPLSVPAGGISVTLAGTGFTAGTSVTIGGTACTSVVVSSPTTLSCLAPAMALGTYDVVVTRGLETETLSSAFTYANLPTLSVSDASVTEGGSAAVTVTLSATTIANVTFSYTTTSGTALSGTDFTATSGTGTILAGQTTTVINVPTTTETTYEANETFDLNISSPSANAVVSDAIGLITINNDDSMPTVNFSAASQSLGEGGGSATVTISLSAVSGLNVTGNYTVSGTASGGGVDHDLAGGTYTITAGSTSTNLTINLVDDVLLDPSETVIVTISTATGGSVGGTSVHTLTINDNETPAVLAISESDPYDFGLHANGASVDHTFTITNSGSISATSISGGGLSAPFTFKGGPFPGTGGNCTATLAAGASCTIVLTFAPTATATHSDTLDISYNDGQAAQTSSRMVQGDSAPPASLSLSDGPTYDYGTKANGSSSDKTFTLSNSGGVAASSISGGILSAPFAYKGGSFPGVGGTCTTTLAAAATCDVVVTYSPTGAGLHSDTIDISYNDGVAVQSATRDIQGTGATPASISISEIDPYDYGTLDLNSSATHAFTLTNTGGVAATGMGESGLVAPFSMLGGSYPGTGGTCGAVLGAGANCTIVVQFLASSIVGPEGSTIEIDYSDGVTTQTATRTVEGTARVTVVPAYNSNGANWNDYVINNGTTPYTATGAACTGTELNFNECLHAGEIRKVAVPPHSTCTNLTVTDSLGAFDWKCEVVSGTATFFSVLKPNKGLRDLINSTPAWIANTVTFNVSGSPISTSTPANWWLGTNVYTLPASPGTAATILNPGSPSIYVQIGNTTAAGYYITSPKVALVTLPGATITWNDQTAMSCNSLDGTNGSPDARCLVFGASTAYLWIEAKLSAFSATNKADYGVLLNNAAFVRIRNTVVDGAGYASEGIGLTNVKTSRLENIESVNSETPLAIWSSTGNLVQNYRLGGGTYVGGGLLEMDFGADNNWFVDGRLANHADGNGINLLDANNNVFYKAVISNIAASGLGSGNLIYLNGLSVTNNTFTNITGFSCADAGIHLATVTGPNIFNHVTVANCTYNAVYLIDSHYNGFNQIVGVNVDTAVQADDSITPSTGNWVSQLVSYAVSYPFYVETGSDLTVTGNVLTETSPTCYAAGLGVNGSCAATGASAYNLVPGINATASFKGKIATNDTANASDSNGAVTFTPTTDLFLFLNPFRAFGKSGSAFPAADNRGADLASGLIWDFSLAAGDSILRNKSGNGSTANGAFTNAAACPSAVDSDTQFVTMGGQTFLRNATEIMGDNINTDDEDGLCESNEACIYSPNFGSYQGSGTFYNNQCNFNSGTGGVGVDNVMMYAYPINGE